MSAKIHPPNHQVFGGACPPVARGDALAAMIHDWPTYAAMVAKLVGEGATAPMDCAAMWLVLHKHHQPVVLVADVLAARVASLLDAKQFEGAQACSRLLVDAAQQTGSSETVAHARQLRYRMHTAQNEHAAAARELEVVLELAPSSRPHLWVELARMRYARKTEEPGALLGAAEALEAALALMPADKSKWPPRSPTRHRPATPRASGCNFCVTRGASRSPTCHLPVASRTQCCTPVRQRLQPGAAGGTCWRTPGTSWAAPTSRTSRARSPRASGRAASRRATPRRGTISPR